MQKRVRLLNVYIDKVDMDQSIEIVRKLTLVEKVSYVVTPNLDFLFLANKNERFRKCIKDSNLSLLDSTPLKWISKLYFKGIKHKISGSVFGPELIKRSKINGFRVFLLGAAEGVAEIAKNRMLNKYIDAQIVGTYSPKFGFEANNFEIDAICKKIYDCEANVVLCGFGTPKQEIFVYDNMKRLPNAVYVGTGATIDFMAGTQKKAPKWMSSVGLEWLYRLIKNPTRLFKRYMRDFLILPVLILKNCSRKFRRNMEDL